MCVYDCLICHQMKKLLKKLNQLTVIFKWKWISGKAELYISRSKNDKNDKKQWTLKIICYNPPYSANIKTNIGKTFLNLIKKHFLKTNKLHEIFNKNTVKISYSCMNNISSVISGHNKNCWIREDCPLENQCLTPNIIYISDDHCEANENYKFYFGVAQTPFKERFRNHSRVFNHKQYIKSTELSKYIWLLKGAGIPYTINWSIVAKLKGSTKINYYPLCLTEENDLTEYFNDIRLLNKKTEFINACRHQSKLLLKNLKRNDSIDWKNIKEAVEIFSFPFSYLFFKNSHHCAVFNFVYYHVPYFWTKHSYGVQTMLTCISRFSEKIDFWLD